MDFLKRFFMLIYMVLMVSVGGTLIAVSVGTVSTSMLTEMLNVIGGDVYCQAVLAAIGGAFVIIGIIVPYRVNRGLRKNRIMAFHNPDGEVTVSLSAIEDYVRKISRAVPGIKDVRSVVDMSKKGINIVTRVSILPNANIPEVTERIQMEVRNRVQAMLGVEEKVTVKMHINKILKGAKGDSAQYDDGAEGSKVPPYREM